MIRTVSPPSPPSPPSAPVPPTELTLSLELQTGSQGGLLRALTVLHRRRCRVLEARFCSVAGADRLTVRLQAPHRHAHCVEAWLSALVEVRAVAADLGSNAVTSDQIDALR